MKHFKGQNSETFQKVEHEKYKKAEHDHAENYNPEAFELIDADVKLEAKLAALNRYSVVK